MKAYLALFRSNMILTLRDRGVLFFSYIFPLIFFFAFTELFGSSPGSGVAYYVTTVLVIGMLGNGLVLMGAEYYVQDIMLGVIIVASVALSASTLKKAAFSV